MLGAGGFFIFEWHLVLFCVTLIKVSLMRREKMKTIMAEIYAGFFQKKHFLPRLAVTTAAVIVMGFCLSWLILVDLGTDPCTLMNVSIAKTIGTSLGNWQLLLNTVLLIVVVLFGGRNLGFGTIANMVLVGYSIDLFGWIWGKVLPVGLFDSWTVKIAVLIPVLLLFVIAVAVYVDMDMGTAPYDAVPIIIANRLEKVPFKVVRIGYDAVVTAIGMAFGGRLGIVTFLMVLALGPVIEGVSSLIRRKWDFSMD